MLTKVIKGAAGYTAGTDGNVYNHKVLVVPSVCASTGKLVVRINNKLLHLHRVIYRTFHDEIDSRTAIYCIDGDNRNTCPNNLSLVSRRHNDRQCLACGRQFRSTGPGNRLCQQGGCKSSSRNTEFYKPVHRVSVPRHRGG